MSARPKIVYKLGSGTKVSDDHYLSQLKELLAARADVKLLPPTKVQTVTEVVMEAKKHGADKVITSNSSLLQKLLNTSDDVSVDDYAGSIIEKQGIDFLIVNPLEQIYSVPWGKHLFRRYFSKFLSPEDWMKFPEFRWELFKPERTNELVDFFAGCNFIAVDIETVRDHPERVIDCIGFTGVVIDPINGTVTAHTVVVPMADMYNYTFIKCLCQLPNPKVFQGGSYDNVYLMRYGIPVTNWAGDTMTMFHCLYSEMPKDLGFIVAYLMRKWQYWKDESGTGNKEEYYQYNAKDAYTTAMCWLVLLREVPAYAIANFLIEFPLLFGCLLAELTGLKADKAAFEAEENRFNEILEKRLLRLQKMVNVPKFNPSSPKQVLQLFAILGCSDITNTKPPSREKVAGRHPLNKRIVKEIESYRKDRKLVTSYLRDYNPKTKKYHTWKGRVFYRLNPGATDTGRLASKESSFWCGMQIQNIPRDRKDIQVKRGFIADRGFLFGEADYEQAEARDVAYLSGDEALIKAVDDVTKDFHGKNASAFFGVDYDKIVSSTYDETTAIWVHDTIDKDLRDLSKRTNHGANYNMGASVMLDTMGAEKVAFARAKLGLVGYSLLGTCQFLLDRYAKTYPVVKGAYYDKIKSDAAGKQQLVSPAVNGLRWTRFCFSDPTKSKLALNSYVAHPSQNLNARTLNVAWNKILYSVWLKHSDNFKLHAQIHDSILFSYRIGHEYLAWLVKECMEFDVPVEDTFGKLRTLRVPVALKGDADRWSEVKPLKKAA